MVRGYCVESGTKVFVQVQCRSCISNAIHMLVIRKWDPTVPPNNPNKKPTQTPEDKTGKPNRNRRPED